MWLTQDENLKRAVDKMVLAKILSIKDNSSIKKTNTNPDNLILLETKDGFNKKLSVNLTSGEHLYEIDGDLLSFTVGNKKVKTIFLRNNFYYTAYNPDIDVYFIGLEAKNDSINNIKSFVNAIKHEIAHNEYLMLSIDEQRDLNNLILHDNVLNIFFRKFINNLFRSSTKTHETERTVKHYSDLYSVNNPQIISLENCKNGFKDDRSLEIKIDNEEGEKEIFLSPAISEFLSFIASCLGGEDAIELEKSDPQNPQSFKRLISDETLIALFALDYINKNIELKDKIEKFKLYKNINKAFLDAFVSQAQINGK